GPNTGHIANVIAGADLNRLFADPTRGPRVPDLVVEPQHRVIYTASAGSIAEHGSHTQDDRNVALLVVPGGHSNTPASLSQPATTNQIAPTTLAYLGLNPNALQAVQQEHISSLPVGS